MSVRATEVEIQRPCPVDLPEDFRAGAKNRHCGHCQKTVHLLSSLSEPEAKTFLAEHANEDICVTYLVDADGTIQFRPQPTLVPVTALRRPRIAAAAAVGLGLALAACAPHDNPRIVAEVTQAETNRTLPTQGETLRKPTPPVEPEHTMIAGGIGPMMDETPPPPPPVVKPPPVVEPKRVMKAGGIRPAPRMVRGGRG